MKFFAIVALAMFATTNAQSAVTAASVTRTTLVQGATPGDVVLTFTATTAVAPAGTVTLTPSADIFTNAPTGCTSVSTSGTTSGTQAVTSVAVAGTPKVLTITLVSGTASNKYDAADVVVLTCTGNLAVNPAAATALTFNVKTNTDLTEVAATGYTTTAGFAAFTATRASLVTAADPGNLIVTITPKVLIAATSGTITLIPSTNIFDADSASATTCTVVITGGSGAEPTMTAAVSLTASAQQVVLTMGSAGTDTIAVDEVATITCTGNMAVVNGAAASAVTFGVKTSGDTTGLTAQTGYTIAAASAASSTASVGMLTMLALAGVAMRQ